MVDIDITSIILVILGFFIGIIVEEYRFWRQKRIQYDEKKKQMISDLKRELRRFNDSWNNFKTIKEMQYGDGLKNFKYDLEHIYRGIENVVLNAEDLLPKDVLLETRKLSNELLSLSKKEFFIDGGKSFKEFIELGDSLFKKCGELLDKLSKLI